MNIPVVESLPGCEIRQMGVNDMPLLHEIWPVPLEKMYKRLERGDDCYSLFIDGRIAHYQWIQTRGWHYIKPAGRWMRIRSGEFMVYHARVADWTRGRRINPFVKSYLLQHYKQAGYHLSWVYTTIGNTNSQKGIERAGWVFDEGFRALDFGSFQFPLPGALKTKPVPTAIEHGSA